jgi:hypothetical protein
MTRHLDDRHWDIDTTVFSVVGHWDDTVRALGGVLGISLIFLGVGGFYWYTMYAINARHEKVKKLKELQRQKEK